MDSRSRLTALVGSVLLLTTLLLVSAATVSAQADVDMSIEKRVIGLPHLRGFAIAGEELIYEITIWNESNNATTGPVMVDDELPLDQVTYLTDTAGCEQVPNGLSCNLGQMAAWEERIIQIKVLVNPDAVEPDGTAVLVNWATVEAPDDTETDLSDNEVQFSIIVEDSADLSVIKMSKPDTQVRAGEPFVHTIFVENLGPSWARNVSIRDEIVLEPFGDAQIVSVDTDNEGDVCNWQETDWGYTILCNRFEPLAVKNAWSEGRWTIQVTMEGQQTQDVNNVVNVFTGPRGTPDPDLSNNTAEDFIYVTDVANLSVTKEAEWGHCATLESTWSVNSIVIHLSLPCAGRPLTYTLTVSNSGPSTAENVVLEELLPAGLTVDSVSAPGGSCTTGIPGNPLAPLVCNLGNLPPGAFISVSVEASIDEDYPLTDCGHLFSFDGFSVPHCIGKMENDAVVYSDIFDPDNSNDRAHLILDVWGASGLEISKTAFPDPVTAGEELHYTLTFTNTGPSAAQDVIITDLVPGDPGDLMFTGYDFLRGGGTCTYVAPSDAVQCNLDDIPVWDGVNPQAQALLHFLVDPSIADGTVLDNCLSGFDSFSAASLVLPIPFELCASTTVQNQSDLSIEKTSNPLKVYPGEQITYEIVVTNEGPSTADPVLVTDILPPEVEYEIDTADCTLAPEDPDTLNCDLGSLAPGESRSFQISALVLPDTPPGTIVNTASANEVFMATAETLVLDPIAANLEITKEYECEALPDNGPECVAGNKVGFFLHIQNHGPLAAENVMLEDLLPEGVTVTGYQGWWNDSEWPALSCNTGIPGDPDAPFTCGLGDVQVGDQIQVNIYTQIDPDYVHPTLPNDFRVMENDALVYSDLYDPNNDNNQTSTIFDVYTMSDVYLWKSGPLTALAGEEISYHIRVRNLGPSTLTNFHFVDALPEEEWNGEDPAVTYLGYEIEQGTGECIYPWPMEGDHNVHCYLDDIAPGGVSVVHLRVLVHPDLEDESSIHNEIDGWYANSGHYVDGPMEVDTEIINDADLSIRKEADPYKVYAGEQVRYDISVTNNGPGIAYNVLVSDTLPSGVEFELATIGCSTASPVTGTMLVSTNPGWDSELFSVDLDTVAVTHLGDMQQPLGTDIEYDALSGKLYASMGAHWDEDLPAPQLHTVDPETAASLGYVELDEDCAVPALEFVGSTLYATCHVPENGGSHLVTLDPSSGHVFFALNDTGYERIHGMAYDASAGVMYGVVKEDDENGDEGDLVSINLSTGEASYVCSTGWDDVTGLDYGPGGILYAATGTGEGGEGDLLTIDTHTCDVTVVGDLGMSAAGLTWVAEPELACPLGEIPPGETRNFSIFVRVKPDTLGMITNRVDVSSDNDPNPDNNWDTEANLVLGKADLKVTKYGKPDGEVRAGEELEYWVVVDNLGPGFAHDVVLYDLISSDGNFELSWFGDSEEYSCQVDNCDCEYDQCWCDDGEAQLTCRLNHPLPVMSPDSSGRWLFKVWVEAYEDQSINNLARVIGSDFDPDLSNNEAIAEHEITAVADLDLHKEAWGEVLVGCDGQTDLWEDEVAAGGMLEYTLNIYNSGPSEAENVVVEDWGLSPFLDIIGVECEKDGEDPGDGCSCNTSELGELGDENRRLVCYLGTIEWTDEDQIRISARIPSDVPEGTRLVNDAKVYSDVFDDDNGGNLASNWTYVTVTADLGVEKSQEPETTLPSLEVVYTIRVDNWGPSDAHGVLISDTLPFTPTIMTVEGCASDGGQCDVPCEVPTCPAGECPWPDVDFVAQANIPAGEHVIYTLTAIPEWVPCEPITNTAQVGFAPGYDDIDPCDCEECDGKDFAYTVSDPECNFVPLVLKSFPGPDSPL